MVRTKHRDVLESDANTRMGIQTRALSLILQGTLLPDREVPLDGARSVYDEPPWCVSRIFVWHSRTPGAQDVLARLRGSLN